MKEAWKTIEFVLTWAFFIGIAYVLIPWQSLGFSGVTTVYTRTCIEEAKTTKDCMKWRAGDAIRFLVVPETQTVTKQYGKNVPFRLTGCAVLDKENWYCEEAREARWLTLDGNYQFEIFDSMTKKFEPVVNWEEISRARWMWMRFRAWTK